MKLEVKTDKSQHALPPPPGQAMMYFVEDDTEFESTPKPITRFGVDGTWVGANHRNSYFSFAIDPGTHHLCASWQSLAVIGARDASAAAHFTAEAGQVYYFRVKNKASRACCHTRGSVARRQRPRSASGQPTPAERFTSEVADWRGKDERSILDIARKLFFVQFATDFALWSRPDRTLR